MPPSAAPATPGTPSTPLTPNGDVVDKSLEQASKAPAGVVLPPRDIRAIVEKTAGYVARNGQVFEQRIREKEKHNPKFSFLNTVDPYYPFYVWRLDEIRAGRGTALAAGQTQAATPAAALPEKPAGPKEPPEFKFSARMPNISAQDLDIVRLTALFVAKHGRSFLTPLSQREARNFQFDFLRPNHSLYQYFSRLVDQYSELLQPNGGPSIEELERNIRSGEKFHILERAQARATWSKYQEKERAKKEEQEDQERLAYAQIDWHDFVVVETVVFTEADDQADLPPPASLNDLQSASLEQKAMMSLHPNQLRIEEAMPTSDMDPWLAPQSIQMPMAMQMPGPSGPQQQYYQQQQLQDDAMDVEMESSDDEDSAAKRAAAQAGATGTAMKIRSDYVPRALAKRQQGQAGICPNCGLSFPLDEMQEHMRIELLDPRWREQRARADAKFATTNLNTNDTVMNLKRLASQRDDLFDSSTGEKISAEELERRKRAATGGAWDGTRGGEEAVRLQSYNLSEQIEAIHRKAGQVANPGVGPKRQ